MDKYSGKKLDGRYDIHELIGTGGMAMVYRAYDTLDDRTVAIKILKDEFSANDEFIRRFKNESKAIAVLNHQNIVKVYDVSFGDVIQYIVMEYIDGITLKEYIELQDNNISWKEAVLFTTQILQALEHAHSKGIVHRDIKPQNIMLLQDGTIKVTDFGIARFSSVETRTMTDKAIGSVHYIAPEQAKGELTDGKTDIYSVGVMLYEMLAGKLPFEADNAVSVAIMQLQEVPKPIKEINPDVPDGLAEITLKAMQKDPSLRYQSAREMLDDIELFKQNPSIVFEYKYMAPKGNSSKLSDSFDDNGGSVSDDAYNDEYGKYAADAEKAKSPAGSIFAGIISAFILVAIVCCILGAFQACQSQNTIAVDIPNFVGMNSDDVINSGKYDFKFETVNSFDPNQAIGTILKQSPESGSKQIKEGSTITLTVNSTSTVVSVPYVNGYSADNALAKMNDKNLKAQIVYVEDPDTAVDMVLDTSPKAGSEVEVDSPIKVFVSRERTTDTVLLPNVVGQSLDSAKYTLESLGFEVDYEYNEKVDKEKDSVLAQSPGYDVEYKVGEKVKLIVAKGIDKTKTCTLNIDLPADVDREVFVRVTIDGVVSEEYSQNVIPKYNSTYEVKITAEGTVYVQVSLNENLYREYEIDFNKGEIVNSAKYDFVEDSTLPTEETTEPETESETDSEDMPAWTDPEL
ncbi:MULTISPECIES: Stk1 family PASTA domain-containing Ser/Thr kinase [unclassified Ruminococcus]|uniref:Stk1 family PASTA domain-containing Ser/Thr kinase n=1 Tax=unclassified Ruminococcus TaxID=2608920 RepID=UPI002109AB23|nr:MULTISPECIES: Stk1 family PASTA domain-containing Ser/Thr kinase [unclassified Ruminococcus]MCQ4022587.1 Stk1 family PASTA domain-containing Ser/Thr kinase [Ruminococcus sp. zg-924]MCQ4114827.1 Stk1 family PASTA domain-containing Ser/Thr kinase [Ruminococcus sp. zg-921]